ncbi:MAG TPA: HEAT repeat domain-containing protein [Deltaproteobacteria bacterium]|nr:HEAT repeat domain-containing protein [Deltaproteobacteria bacterium]HPR55683.1 HEAT repeat domain-containing protein [Deltaproteobacteria bacterium]
MDYSEIDVLMASNDSSDRRTAATRLGESGNDSSIERLIVLLRDTNSGVRDAAQNALMFMGGRTAVEMIFPLVAEVDPGLRNAAIDILRKIGDDGIDVMHGLAEDPNDDIRLFVLDILGTIRNPESVEVLIRGLTDPNPNVRNAAVVSLGLIGDPKAFEHLKPLIDDEEWIRFSTIEALSHIPHEDLPEFLLGQLEKWKHDELTISALLETMGKIRPKQVAGTLIAMLEHAGPYIEIEAVKALIKILTPDEIAGLPAEDSATVKSIMERHLAEIEDELLGDMLPVLSRIGDRASGEAVIELARGTDPDTQPDRFALLTDTLCGLNDLGVMEEILDGEDKLRILAANVLARIGGRKGARLIGDRIFSTQCYVKRVMTDALAAVGGADLRGTFHRLLKETDGHVVSSSLRALGRIGDPDDIAVIQTYLRHRYPDVREVALASIVEIGTIRAEEVFMAMCEETEPAWRITALNGLERMESHRLADVAQAFLNDGAGDVRAAAIEVIRDRDLSITPEKLRELIADDQGQIRHAAIDIVGLKKVGDLREVLEDTMTGSDMWAASHAIEALGMFRDSRSRDRLLGMLASESDFLRITAIKTLGGWKEEELATELEPYIDDPNPDVSRAVIDAIDHLQGVSF